MTPVSWTGKKPFGHDHVEEDGEHEGPDGHDHRRLLPFEDPAQGPPVGCDGPIEHAPGCSKEPSLLLLGRVLEETGAHHGRQGQGDDGGNEDRDAQGDGELAEEPSHNVAHEQERNEDRDEGDRQGQNGEADLLRTLEGRLKRRVALLYEPGDILDHDYGVIHDKTGGDGECHQREVVEAETREDT